MGLNVLRAANGIAAKMIAGASSVGTYTEHDLDHILGDWSLQVVTASTDANITLDLSLDPSTSPTYVASLIWSTTGGQASGDIVTLADTPARQIRASLVAGGSSGGADAWVCAR